MNICITIELIVLLTLCVLPTMYIFVSPDSLIINYLVSEIYWRPFKNCSERNSHAKAVTYKKAAVYLESKMPYFCDSKIRNIFLSFS